jgi:tRNA modification GTPase
VKHWADQDTIAALSTPPGQGAIGIVRISGPEAGSLLRKFCDKGAEAVARPRRLTLGWFLDSSQLRVDQVLAAFLPGPKTYTGQDMAEIQAHGGPVVLSKILGEIIAAGARPAEPGEFTWRAFMNGKLDLSQAEAVSEIIQAKTGQALKLARRRLAGRLGEKIAALRSALVDILARVEAEIDFPEDDLSPMSAEEISQSIQTGVLDPLDGLLALGLSGHLVQEGAVVVLAGRPNVGKSSLLNTLLDQDRAIVTEIPGTTRDLIEEWLDLSGLPVRLVDGAGWRRVDDPIESQGVARATARAAQADLVLFLTDGSTPLIEQDFEARALLAPVPVIPVVNKIDLPRGPGFDPTPLFPDADWSAISALTGQGLTALRQRIVSTLIEGGPDFSAVAPNLRQHLALSAARQAVAAARDGIYRNISPELAAVDFREALFHLDEITGGTASDEVLDRIFSTFCIGK